MVAGKRIRIALGEAEFFTLVDGQTVTLSLVDGRAVSTAPKGADQTIEIILSDIGFGRMQAALMRAVRRSEERG